MMLRKQAMLLSALTVCLLGCGDDGDTPSAGEPNPSDTDTQTGDPDPNDHPSDNDDARIGADTQTLSPDNAGDTGPGEHSTGGSAEGGATGSEEPRPETGTDTSTDFATEMSTTTIPEVTTHDTDTGTDTGAPPVAQDRSDKPYDTDPDLPPGELEQFVANTNAFGMEVFTRLLDDEPNVVCSPLSISTALAMVYGGARNNTATEMAAAMRNDLPDDTFHLANNRLLLDIAARKISSDEDSDYDGERSVEISVANAVWVQQGLPVHASFLDLLAVRYDSGSSILDFISDPEGSRTTINGWVADRTRNRIQDLIPEGMIGGETMLVLTNALYFKGSWESPFEPYQTGDDYFYPLEGDRFFVPTMYNTLRYAYTDGEGYQMIDLPYVGNELSMTVLLPADGRFETIRNQLSAEWIQSRCAEMQTDRDVALSLPKFRFTWGTKDLKEQLQALGMIEAFSRGADFSGISGTPMAIDFVLHKAFIEVDEHGTEAAAATAIGMDAGAAEEPETTISMAVNRPFFFFIRDTVNQAILFSGQIKDPTL